MGKKLTSVSADAQAADINSLVNLINRTNNFVRKKTIAINDDRKRLSQKKVAYQKVDEDYRAASEKLLHAFQILVCELKTECQLQENFLDRVDSVSDLVANFKEFALFRDDIYEDIDRNIPSLSHGDEKQQKVLAEKRDTVVSIIENPILDRKIMAIYSKSVLRPQVQYNYKIDNARTKHVPQITTKPNALVELDPVFLSKDQDIDYPHPYSYEIEHVENSAYQLSYKDKIGYADIDQTPLVYADTENEFYDVLEYLNTISEIAIDLEHHSYRSYQGFTCLMQISTRERDIIIDVIKLRCLMWRLNEPFTNPQILKVFHGSHQDILWLQKDFGVYVVNMFDTFIACKYLGTQKKSLSHLSELYVGLSRDKKYQLIDWRIRPLPSDALMYAREDTHYLLYIYDAMKNQILGQDATGSTLKKVYEESNKLSAKVYRKTEYNDDTWKLYLMRQNINPEDMDGLQMNMFKHLHEWRDSIARAEDESPDYIMPKRVLVETSKRMPENVKDLMEMTKNIGRVPPLVKQHASDIVLLCKNVSKKEPLDVEEVRSFIRARKRNKENGADYMYSCDNHTFTATTLEDDSTGDMSVEINAQVIKADGDIDRGVVDHISKSLEYTRSQLDDRSHTANIPEDKDIEQDSVVEESDTSSEDDLSDTISAIETEDLFLGGERGGPSKLYDDTPALETDSSVPIVESSLVEDFVRFDPYHRCEKDEHAKTERRKRKFHSPTKRLRK